MARRRVAARRDRVPEDAEGHGPHDRRADAGVEEAARRAVHTCAPEAVARRQSPRQASVASPASQRRSRAADFCATSSSVGATFDLLVIGGGVTGAGIARDAALRGLEGGAGREGPTSAAGTSSKSSKLVHGGLRYLEHAQFRLVFEGTNERALLMKRAPHLVRPLPFLCRSYKRRQARACSALDVGLWIYDALVEVLVAQAAHAYGARGALELEPGLKRRGARGRPALLRLHHRRRAAHAREHHRRAARSAPTIVNYTRAVEAAARRRAHRRRRGPRRPAPPTTARRSRCARKVTVNATGPWSDEVRALAGEHGHPAPTKGVHLVRRRASGCRRATRS